MKAGPLFLAGATVTGKSEVALLLAEQLNGEIISVDSMQVYRGLDIGTAKPSAAEQQRVPHHLIDVAGLDESFDAARFVRLAQAVVIDVEARGRVPIFCGGTGLYFQAYLAGLGEAPPADAALRVELAATAMPALLDELQQRDPIAFAQIDRQNPRRVIRAVEVIRLSGKPFSSQKAAWPAADKSSPLFVLAREPADLQARLNARVETMFQRGLVDEVKQLLPRGLAQNQTAMQAIGYRQVVEHLNGAHALAQTIELVKIRTRQFAKRQHTWFKRQASAQWIACAPAETAKVIAERIAGYRKNNEITA